MMTGADEPGLVRGSWTKASTS